MWVTPIGELITPNKRFCFKIRMFVLDLSQSLTQNSNMKLRKGEYEPKAASTTLYI